MSNLSLRQWRLAKEITVDKMAEIIGVHPNTYRNWEDEPEKISVSFALKISDALGESIDTIFLHRNST